MTLDTVIKLLEAEVHTGESPEELANHEVKAACGSDLMSDVLAFVKTQGLLLTGLVNPQVIRTAEMMDMQAIVFVRGKEPTEAVIELAQERGIALLSTAYTMYVACGKLYTNGLGKQEE